MYLGNVIFGRTMEVISSLNGWFCLDVLELFEFFSRLHCHFLISILEKFTNGLSKYKECKYMSNKTLDIIIFIQLLFYFFFHS